MGYSWLTSHKPLAAMRHMTCVFVFSNPSLTSRKMSIFWVILFASYLVKMNRIKSIKQLTTGVIVLVGLTLFVILLNSDTKEVKTTPIAVKNRGRVFLYHTTGETNSTGYGHKSEFKQQLLKWNNHLVKQLDKRASKTIRWFKEFKNESFPLQQNVLDVHRHLKISKIETDSLRFQTLQLQHRKRVDSRSHLHVFSEHALLYELCSNLETSSEGVHRSCKQCLKVVKITFAQCEWGVH